MKNRNIIIIGIGLAALVALVYLLSKNMRQRFDWRETYEEESKDPYGTFVIQQLLKDYFPGEPFSVLKDSISFDSMPNHHRGNYIFIGPGLRYDTSTQETLIQFVEDGGQAMIISHSVPKSLMDQIYPEDCYHGWEDYSLFRDSVFEAKLYHPDFSEEKYTFKYYNKGLARNYNWHYVPYYMTCEETGEMAILGGTPDSTINFFRFPLGNGHFYFHCTPLAFSNIQLLEESGLEYAERVFSHLQTGPIYWDDFNRTSEFVARQMNRSNDSSRRLSADSPLSYILSQPPLAWAWYLLLSMSLLYLVFRAKRKQRLIPVMEENRNTSLEFLSTIGRLYFLQNNHKELASQKMKLFLSYIRERYYLNTKELDATFVKKLANKSEIGAEKIDQIILLSQNMKNSNFVSDKTLIDFHQQIDYFYKNCK